MSTIGLARKTARKRMEKKSKTKSGFSINAQAASFIQNGEEHFSFPPAIHFICPLLAVILATSFLAQQKKAKNPK